MAIERQEPVRLSQDWGVEFSDYMVNGKLADFEDLAVRIAENRAVAVEKEVAPLSTRIQIRNKELELLGSLLGIFTQTQAKYASDAAGNAKEAVSGVTAEMVPLACKAYRMKGGTPSTSLSWWNEDWTKSSVEGMIQTLKTMIDSRNNASQTDMTRLQSLVDRRDEAYSTASDLMGSVSDTRGTLISNL